MNNIEIQYKKLNEIKPYEKNPRKNDDAVPYVLESIKEYGFKVPIVIDKNGVIVTGHTRYKAASQLGLSEVPCIIADDLTDKQIKAFRLADNKVSDYSLWDNKLLLEELEGLEEIFTGFDTSDIFNDILNEAETVSEELVDGFYYEIKLQSENEDKINKIKELWEKMNEE